MTCDDPEMLLDYKTLKIEILAIFGPFWPFLPILGSLGVPPPSGRSLGERKLAKMTKNGHSGHFGPQDVTRVDPEMFLDYKTFKIEILAILGHFWVSEGPVRGYPQGPKNYPK